MLIAFRYSRFSAACYYMYVIFRFFLVQSSPRLGACNQLLYAAKEGLAFGKGTHYARYIARYLRGKTVFQLRTRATREVFERKVRSECTKLRWGNAYESERNHCFAVH